MKRKSFLLALFSGTLFAQRLQKKFYITGYFHTQKFNDCTLPPIISYGRDRLDALQRCCDNGALTVWSEEEYLETMKRIGPILDKTCADALKGDQR